MRSAEVYELASDEHVLQMARMLEAYWDSRIENAIQVVVNTIERGAMDEAMAVEPARLGYVQGMRQGALGVLAHLQSIRVRAAEIVNRPIKAEAEEAARQMAFGGGTLSGE